MLLSIAKAAKGFRDSLDHYLSVRAADARVQVTYKGEVIADSRDAVRLDEATYPAVYYFPRKDVKMERFTRSDHESYSAYKGCASYYSLKNGPEDAVWSYEDPCDEMRMIRGRIAFYPDKVDSIVSG